MSIDDRDRGDAPGRFPDLARFAFALRARDSIALPEYPGSAWRGLLGHGLRRSACVTRQPTCAGCLLVQSCVYSLIFETPPPPDLDIAGFTAMPHPFVLDIDPGAPRQYRGGDALGLGLTLIGSAIAQVPYLIHAMTGAGQQGLGRERGQFQLETVARETLPGSDRWEPVYAADGGAYRPVRATPAGPPSVPESARLRLRTPLRIKRDGHFVAPERFALDDFLRHLYSRLQRLALLYGGRPETFVRAAASALAAGLRMPTCELHWHDWTRYSSRQSALMQLGGLLGELTIAGPALPGLWPALWFGQWTHVGKGTAFGLGSYRLEPV
jgi:hypothetical protein